MRYMMLIYSREDEAATPEDMRAVAAAHKVLMDQTRDRGIFCAADPLQPSVTATTVRVQDGKSLVTDGPFAETKEQLGGYYLIEAASIDEAASIASGIPAARFGSIEVRPIMVFS